MSIAHNMEKRTLSPQLKKKLDSPPHPKIVGRTTTTQNMGEINSKPHTQQKFMPARLLSQLTACAKPKREPPTST